MKKTFILSVILLIVGNVHTQPLAWSKQTTRGFISSFYVTTDNTGNVFTTGWFNDTTDFDPGPGVYKLFSRNPSTYLSKLDRNGNFLWAVNVADLSGNGNSSAGRFGITTDLYGNVYVAGFFKGTCDFDPGSGTKLLTVNTTTPSPYGYDQFVWKLDANGNFIWVKQLATNQFVSTCLTDASGNLLVSGSFNGTCDFDPGPGTQTLKSLGVSDGYICTFDQAGNILDVKQFGYTGTNASISSLSFDTFSNIIAIGSFTGTVDADPGPGTFILSAAGSQFFTTQLNSTGNFVTARSIIPLGTSKITKLSTDFYGNTYVEGTFTGSCDFDPSVSVHTLQTSAPMAIFVYKLSPTGGFTWAKKVDLQSSLNQYPHIRSDGGGNVHFTGVFNGTVDVDPGSAVHTLSTQPYKNSFLSTLNAPGDFVSAVCETAPSDMHVDLSGNVYIISYGYTAKYSSLFTDLYTHPKKETLIQVFPNPGNGEFILNSGPGSEWNLVEIFNLSGQKIYEKILERGSSTIDLRKNEPGIYFLQLTDHLNNRWYRKIIKN